MGFFSQVKRNHKRLAHTMQGAAKGGKLLRIRRRRASAHDGTSIQLMVHRGATSEREYLADHLRDRTVTVSLETGFCITDAFQSLFL
jgi:hypothetical protein